MADKTQKVPENVPGKWYVDDTCTPCHTCMEEAGGTLLSTTTTRPRSISSSSRRMRGEDAADRAMNVCPTGSIGSDGE